MKLLVLYSMTILGFIQWFGSQIFIPIVLMLMWQFCMVWLFCVLYNDLDPDFLNSNCVIAIVTFFYSMTILSFIQWFGSKFYLLLNEVHSNYCKRVCLYFFMQNFRLTFLTFRLTFSTLTFCVSRDLKFSNSLPITISGSWIQLVAI